MMLLNIFIVLFYRFFFLENICLNGRKKVILFKEVINVFWNWFDNSLCLYLIREIKVVFVELIGFIIM